MSDRPSSPQAQQMADESMVRNLAAQASAIWPAEERLFDRYGIGRGARILDVGCGTGEIVSRLAARFPDATIVGVDLEASHLERAERRCAAWGERVRFARADALCLELADGAFDLVVSRHVLQALPDAPRAVAELARVTRPGGFLHVLAEDYGMLLCHPTPVDSDNFWQRLPHLFAEAVGCDNKIGRKLFTVLSDLALSDIAVDYIVVDTLRVAREIFAAIWEAWRDGYSDALVEHTPATRAEVDDWWRQLIACVRDPRGYALWQVPVWSARKP